jgi:hypothetical protein
MVMSSPFLGSANLTLLASVVSRSRIHSGKQYLRTPLRLPQRDTANTNMPRTENWQGAFLLPPCGVQKGIAEILAQIHGDAELESANLSGQLGDQCCRCDQ